MSKSLFNFIDVAPRFQRSIRIDHDYGNSEALEGYVLLSSAAHAYSTLIQQISETPQRAFTWTGPYGGGKSSLALFIASLLGPSGRSKNLAKNILSSEELKQFSKALPSKKAGWLVAPVVGHRGSIVEEIGNAFQKHKGKKKLKNYSDNPRELIADLCNEANRRGEKDGVLILIDEMGKFLEGSAERGEDIYFLQDLAESASRCEGKLVIIGILHQAFEHYANRLGRQARDEWAKIQGRFVDIPLSSAVDELVDLIGRAISKPSGMTADKNVIKNVYSSVLARRPALTELLGTLFEKCWPLHPVSAMLLSQISKHRFGQNERSCFAFLTSAEPWGFQDYLHSVTFDDLTPYGPERLWDYLQANLEPSILASPDGHRWAQASDAIDRAISKGSSDHVRLTKVIAVIDLFKTGSGLAPESKILRACLSDLEPEAIDNLLEDLTHWSIVVHRKHIDAFGVFAGSDFDIELAVIKAQGDIDELDYAALNRLANSQPVLAKSLYHQTGTLRWLDTEIVSLDDVSQKVETYTPQNGAAGCMFLAIPEENASVDQLGIAQTASTETSDQIIVVGIPKNSVSIRDYSRELLALEQLQTKHPELEGDRVARRELASRINTVTSLLQNELQLAFSDAYWNFNGEKIKLPNPVALSRFVSKIIGDLFSQAPNINNELLNRQKSSSNAMAARRNLLHAMVNHAEEKDLAIEGYPAERGIYETAIKVFGIHTKNNAGRWHFKKPTKNKNQNSLIHMWAAAEDLFEKSSGSPITLESIYDMWRRPPYGIKEGILPIFAIAFLLSQEGKIAIYHNGYYQPQIDVLMVDRILQKPVDFSIRKHVLTKFEKAILSNLSDGLAKRTNSPVESTPLSVARRLVKVAYGLPNWTKGTKSVSEKASKFRNVLLNAKDPIRALFEDIPKIAAYSGKSKTSPEKLSNSLLTLLDELIDAYPNMLSNLRSQLISGLGKGGASLSSALKELSKTAINLKEQSGDPILITFASRITELSKDPLSVAQVAGILINKPPRDWTDEETKKAETALGSLCIMFRQEEAYQDARQGNVSNEAVTFIFGAGDNAKKIVAENDYSENQEKVKEAQSQLESLLDSAKISEKAKLALIARIGVKLGMGSMT